MDRARINQHVKTRAEARTEAKLESLLALAMAEVGQRIEEAGGLQQIVRLLSEGLALQYNAATALAALAIGGHSRAIGQAGALLALKAMLDDPDDDIALMASAAIAAIASDDLACRAAYAAGALPAHACASSAIAPALYRRTLPRPCAASLSFTLSARLRCDTTPRSDARSNGRGAGGGGSSRGAQNAHLCA